MNHDSLTGTDCVSSFYLIVWFLESALVSRDFWGIEWELLLIFFHFRPIFFNFLGHGRGMIFFLQKLFFDFCYRPQYSQSSSCIPWASPLWYSWVRSSREACSIQYSQKKLPLSLPLCAEKTFEREPPSTRFRLRGRLKANQSKPKALSSFNSGSSNNNFQSFIFQIA